MGRPDILWRPTWNEGEAPERFSAFDGTRAVGRIYRKRRSSAARNGFGLVLTLWRQVAARAGEKLCGSLRYGIWRTGTTMGVSPPAGPGGIVGGLDDGPGRRVRLYGNLRGGCPLILSAARTDPHTLSPCGQAEASLKLDLAFASREPLVDYVVDSSATATASLNDSLVVVGRPRGVTTLTVRVRFGETLAKTIALLRSPEDPIGSLFEARLVGSPGRATFLETVRSPRHGDRRSAM